MSHKKEPLVRTLQQIKDTLKSIESEIDMFEMGGDFFGYTEIINMLLKFNAIHELEPHIQTTPNLDKKIKSQFDHLKAQIDKLYIKKQARFKNIITRRLETISSKLTEFKTSISKPENSTASQQETLKYFEKKFTKTKQLAESDQFRTSDFHRMIENIKIQIDAIKDELDDTLIAHPSKEELQETKRPEKDRTDIKDFYSETAQMTFTG